MRKFAVVGLAVLGLFAVAGIAYAANTYTSTSKITPSKLPVRRPSPRRSRPSLTFTVGETTGKRPSPLKTYGIGLGAGHRPEHRVARGCTKAQANSPGPPGRLRPEGEQRVARTSAAAPCRRSRDRRPTVPASSRAS